MSCETCYWWVQPAIKGWSECRLTAPDSHEALVKQVVYAKKGQEWHPLKSSKKLMAILHTRHDFSCAQHEDIEREPY